MEKRKLGYDTQDEAVMSLVGRLIKYECQKITRSKDAPAYVTIGASVEDFGEEAYLHVFFYIRRPDRRLEEWSCKVPTRMTTASQWVGEDEILEAQRMAVQLFRSMWETNNAVR